MTDSDTQKMPRSNIGVISSAHPEAMSHAIDEWIADDPAVSPGGRTPAKRAWDCFNQWRLELKRTPSAFTPSRPIRSCSTR